MVCPVGAVSNSTWSNCLIGPSESVSNSVNSLNEAISVVQDPESCSVIARSSCSGNRPRTGPMMRSRYSSAAWSGLISNADNPSTAAMGVMVLPIVRPKT